MRRCFIHRNCTDCFAPRSDVATGIVLLEKDIVIFVIALNCLLLLHCNQEQ